jgi:hypothetical protein
MRRNHDENYGGRRLFFSSDGLFLEAEAGGHPGHLRHCRYLYLVHQKGKGGSPEELIIQDKPLLLNILLWGASIILIIYFR